MTPSSRAAASLVLIGALALLPGRAWAAPGPYTLDFGDTVQISVRDQARFGGTFPVRPDGVLTIPHVTELAVRGKTVEEVRAQLTAVLSRQLHDVDVSVVVVTYRPRIVTVVGEIVRPGNVPLSRPDQTVLDTIADAGGFTLRALPAQVVVLRGTGKATTRIPVNVEEMLATGEMQGDIRLEPGDRIQVARNPWPSLQETVTVTQQVVGYLGTLALLLMLIQRFTGTTP